MYVYIKGKRDISEIYFFICINFVFTEDIWMKIALLAFIITKGMFLRESIF